MNPQAEAQITIRTATDADARAMQVIVAAVYGEYDGCVFDMEELPELHAPATSFREAGGIIWVAEKHGGDGIVGCVGVTPDQDDDKIFQLRKLYLKSSVRGIGLGRRLIEHAQTYVKSNGGTTIYLWSDTRFLTAHSVYQRSGYLQTSTRKLHDRSNSVEYKFIKKL